MKNVDDLIESAGALAERGFSRGEIADELNVSRETASWLAERNGAAPAAEPEVEPAGGPHDIHVDWSALGRIRPGSRTWDGRWRTSSRSRGRPST
jgi:Orotate phosphoribosyltransferase homologs